MKETITIEIDRYKDPQGNPTCANNLLNGEVCIFYDTTRFGIDEICILHNNLLKRTFDSNTKNYGYLIPCNNCLIWKDK